MRVAAGSRRSIRGLPSRPRLGWDTRETILNRLDTPSLEQRECRSSGEDSGEDTMSRSRSLTWLAFLGCVAWAAPIQADMVYPGRDWEEATPESQGSRQGEARRGGKVPRGALRCGRSEGARDHPGRPHDLERSGHRQAARRVVRHEIVHEHGARPSHRRREVHPRHSGEHPRDQAVEDVPRRHASPLHDDDFRLPRLRRRAARELHARPEPDAVRSRPAAAVRATGVEVRVLGLGDERARKRAHAHRRGADRDPLQETHRGSDRHEPGRNGTGATSARSMGSW